MKCPMCDHDISIHEKYCSYCGENNMHNIDKSPEPKREEQTNDITWTTEQSIVFLLSIFIPIVGFVMYYAKKEDDIRFAKACLIAGFINLLLYMLSVF